MHERRLLGSLADAVQHAAGADVGRVTEIRLRVGALATVDAAGLGAGLSDLVRTRWGGSPRVVADVDYDTASHEVRLIGMTVGG